MRPEATASPEPLTILRDGQPASNQPDLQLENVQPGTYRELPSLAEHVGLYLARGADATVCLVVSYSNGSGGGSCVEEDTFLEQGLKLGSRGGRYSLGSDTIRTVIDELYTLLADGTFAFEMTFEDSTAERTPTS